MEVVLVDTIPTINLFLRLSIPSDCDTLVDPRVDVSQHISHHLQLSESAPLPVSIFNLLVLPQIMRLSMLINQNLPGMTQLCLNFRISVSQSPGGLHCSTSRFRGLCTITLSLLMIHHHSSREFFLHTESNVRYPSNLGWKSIH